MLANSVKAALAELAGAPDPATVRGCLDRVGAALMQAPQDGAGLVRALGRTEAHDFDAESLHQILSAALDGARMAREKGQARGAVLIASLGVAVAQLGGEGGLTLAGSLALSRAWVRAGLAPPEQLAMPQSRPDEVQPEYYPVDPGPIDAMIDDLFGDLIRHAEGDALALHGALSEMLPSLPAGVREMVLTTALTRPGQIFGQLGCAFLLDPAPATRLAAAQGLAARLTAGRLEAQGAAQLVTLRSWLPEDAARAGVDTLVRDAMRRGVSGGAAPQPWQVHRVPATLPDGTGAQSIGVSAQRGSQRAMAMLLLKQDFGVKDAYMISCGSASEQRRILASLEAETAALPVPPSYLAAALELALADGLDHGLPPAPGLMAIAEVCGLTGLRPQDQTTADLLAACDPEGRLTGLSPQARGRLINASEFWPDDHPLTDSWFEDSDTCRAALEGRRGPRVVEAALWAWLETRRDWWARIMARSAMALRATGHADALNFAATARSLLEGRALRKIPILLAIHDQTIGAWLHGEGAGVGGIPDTGLQRPDDPADLPPMPAPEKKGELRKLLNGTDLSPGWIDGFLAAVCIAPKRIAPDRWAQPLVQIILPDLPQRNLRRFLDLLIHRYNASLAGPEGSGDWERAFNAMEMQDLCDWCDGFLTARQSFRTFWPAKASGPADKAILRRIGAMADDPASAPGAIPALASWLSARREMARN